MSEYTEEQLKDAARKALADENPAAAKRFLDAARAVAASTPAEAAPKRTFGEMLYENVMGSGEVDTPGERFGAMIQENLIGRGEVDTPGERLGELIRGAGAATARGIADVPAIPANIAQLGAMGVEKAFGMEDPSMVSRALDRLPDTRNMLSAVTGGESDYQAPGTAGEYISTMGEFGGGAGAMAGPRAMLRYGAAPGVTSEAAGQLTEGKPIEPFARAGAALLTPSIAGRVVSPFGGADRELIAASKRARDMGLTPSAGQTVGSRTLQGIEGTLSTTPRQLDEIAAAAMRTVGSNAPRVTPAALVEVGKNLGDEFNDVLKGVSSIPSTRVTAMVNDVVENYIQSTPAAAPIPRIRTLADEIIATSSGQKTVSLETFKRWRTEISNLLGSESQSAADAARGLRAAIDEATDQSLRAAGRVDDIARLAKVRQQWWNFMGLKDWAKGAGQNARLGRPSPESLRAAVRRTQGDEAISMGRGTDLARLAETAEAAIPSVPMTSAGGVRTVSPEMILGAGGYATGGVGGLVAGLGASAGATQLAMNPRVQQYLRNQAAGPVTATGMKAMLPGLLSQATEQPYNPTTGR